VATPRPSSTGPSWLGRPARTVSYRRAARAIIASASSPARARMQADGPIDDVLDELCCQPRMFEATSPSQKRIPARSS